LRLVIAKNLFQNFFDKRKKCSKRRKNCFREKSKKKFWVFFGLFYSKFQSIIQGGAKKVAQMVKWAFFQKKIFFKTSFLGVKIAEKHESGVEKIF
jgi:hypothetical protein